MTYAIEFEEILGSQICDGEALALPWRAIDVQWGRSASGFDDDDSGVKRAFDMTIAAVMLILLAPLCALVAALIRLGDGGPAIFWQTRVGRRGREFRCPKFRSMQIGSEELLPHLLPQNDHCESITFKMRSDPRVTPVGRLLRRLSIDELPQLWCVLRGEMSMVGPRPALPREVACYSARERRRLEAVPGLTCLWQVSGRGDLPFSEQLRLDLQYIDRQSLALDCRLLLRTIPAVLTGRGAY